MQNPYNQQTQEAKFLAYEHAYNAINEEENPYEKDMDPDLYHVWTQGFRANKKRPKPAKSKPEPIITEMAISNPEAYVEQAPTTNSGLSSYGDYTLLQELKKRKAKELELLLKQKELIDNQVAKLKALMEL